MCLHGQIGSFWRTRQNTLGDPLMFIECISDHLIGPDDFPELDHEDGLLVFVDELAELRVAANAHNRLVEIAIVCDKA